MQITLSQAGFAGNAKNCVYPRIVVAADAETLKAAVKNDHVCGIFKDHHRSIDNFESCDAVVIEDIKKIMGFPHGWGQIRKS